ncbi:Stk1 family PASTA domain-containing Ser/Thr kinase [Peribacillus loiseleuriae]|uniref:Serine/threonine-protein kinase PrkC n=1 Tax=Peribacillus loiseleuriae TaxID=1679170 RepID=A0A0K9GRY5_9BACI|nr:Stk1 family PASTA domain-containing Ser/Thr kinase [Peribacillus loiseleuriae]KMY49400.1 serine/threonine protein kinase [Peribacillus loiseleuriae]
MLIGKRINGRYKLLEMVGGGGMANVYLAQDMILEREVALKILRMDFNNDEEFIKRFNREAQSATSLTHPNIVSIYDVGEEDDIYYIVMEYVRGLTLKQYIQKFYPVPIEKALDILKQITSALSQAHHNGIIHRDIKPQNILIDDHGNVKITDFGIALALSATNITQTNAVLGSVHYLSPEQARGGMANNKSDIYSLGIVMFELLTGRLPFSGESAVSIALKHLQSETPSPKRWNPSIPQSVENIILKATAKDSYYRYETVDEMEDDIRSALNPERTNETPFVIPEDMDATKAIPIITNDNMSGIDETIIRGPEKTTVVYREEEQDEPQKGNKKAKKVKQNKKKRKKWPLILFSTFFILLVLTAGAIYAYPNFMGPKDVTIPDVRGEKADDAIAKLEEHGFIVTNPIPLDDEVVPEGSVIRIDPQEGQTVKEGREIKVFVSSGKKKIVIADYTNRIYDDVQSLIAGYLFKDVIITPVFDESEPGTIVSQSPSSELELIPSDTVLELTVSKGPDDLSLKNLKEFNQTGLDDYAKDAGITINVVREEYSDTIGEGLVISQEPAPFTRIKKGSPVNVVLSKGKEEIPPKQVNVNITIPYEPEEEGQPQEVQIFIEDMNHSMTETYEPPFFITSEAYRTLEFTVQHNKKAGYKVVRDGQVILDEKVEYTKE